METSLSVQLQNSDGSIHVRSERTQRFITQTLQKVKLSVKFSVKVLATAHPENIWEVAKVVVVKRQFAKKKKK